MRVLLFKIILLFLSSSVYAQERKVDGNIKTSNNLPVPYANVVVMDTSTPRKSLAYTISDDQGLFSFRLPAGIKNVVINVTAISYSEKNITLLLDTMKHLVIYLDTSVKLLEEVVVKARSATDTLNIGIDSMNLTKDATLRDILNKTDGVLVSKEGGISYQGKQINQVLINNKEVFVNQNKVALDNLNYEIMKNVQIINNYKDKFTIDFNRIRDPVININTKSEFKGIVKIQLDLGYGFKNSYGLKGKGFFFSDKLNAFATSHTNNVGQKEISQSDVSAPLDDRASGWLNKSLTPFFIEDYQMKKNFVSNNSFTLRWQGDKDKAGLVFFHGKINTAKETDNTVFIANTLIKKSNLKNTEKGSFYQTTLNYSRILSHKSVLENVLSAVALHQKQYRENIDTQFVPNIINLREQTNDRPKSFGLANGLKYTRLRNNKTAFEMSLNYFYEDNSRGFETKLVSISPAGIIQNSFLTNQYIAALSTFKFRFRKGVNFNTGISLSQNNESARLASPNHSNAENNLRRSITTIELPLSLSGSIRKWDYSFRASPVYITTARSDGRGFLKMSHSLTHNFEAQNNLILGFSRSYQFFDLYTLFDTVVQTYNYKIINTLHNLNELSIKEEASVSWFNSNVAKSKMLYFTYNFTTEKNTLQSVFDSVANNVFYYSNRLFKKNSTHTFNAGGRKNFYITPAYHRLDIGGGLKFTLNNYETIINNRNVKASITSWEPAATWGFTPRDFLLKSITGRVQWNSLLFNVDGEGVARESIFINTIAIESVIKKIYGKLEYSHLFYNLSDRKFNVPDCNLTFKYNLTEKFALSASGRSLLTLFDLNNYSFVNIVSDGNTLSQTVTSNNLGYLIFFISLKL